jgi:hypothetical protein
MTPGRKTTVPSGMNLAFGTPSDEEIREAVSGYAACFGTFAVDPATKTVIHHAQAALVPSWVGPRTKRIWQREAH